MTIFIINLLEAKERKLHVLNQIKSYIKYSNIIIIKACDGSGLSEIDKEKFFDIKKYKKKNLWMITNEEIGCTLSHRKCLQSFIKTHSRYGLVIEDDINVIKPLNKYIEYSKKILKSSKPRIVLLSGWHWFSNKKEIANNEFICKVVDARLAHAYIINRPAALLILSRKPYFIADHWREIKKMGIEIFAFTPHPIDQMPKDKFVSQIQKGKKGIYLFGLYKWIISKLIGIRRRLWRYYGNYESYN